MVQSCLTYFSRVNIGEPCQNVADGESALIVNGSGYFDGNLSLHDDFPTIEFTNSNYLTYMGMNTSGNIILNSQNGGGNFGIGPGNPDSKLKVNGGARIEDYLKWEDLAFLK
ncbi:MAG: hypothetical protein IPP25_07995 [Saprospiraceae bacterium]|nr:hypothetical protein [Candidatus Opimibacter skivensis]